MRQIIIQRACSNNHPKLNALAPSYDQCIIFPVAPEIHYYLKAFNDTVYGPDPFVCVCQVPFSTDSINSRQLDLSQRSRTCKMPGIEVLPNSTSISAPGWAYVPDVGYDPSKAAIQPTGGRKRAARASGFAGGDTTSRQHNATLRHLAELDRDNPQGVVIPVPSRFKEKAGSKTKTTPNVRRILTSQKTFANHLADEEAALASQDQQSISSVSSKAPLPTLAKKASVERRSSTVAQEAPPSIDEARPDPCKIHIGRIPEDAGSQDPLLRSYVPQMPSEAVMDALLAGPPLSYGAARAAPAIGKPQRYFCEICGYWGTIKCLKCGVRVCGLECKTTHDDGKCAKFYA